MGGGRGGTLIKTLVGVGSGPKLIRKRCLFVILTTVSRDSSYSCDDK